MIRKKKINKKAICFLIIFILLLIAYTSYEFYQGQIEKNRKKEEISKKLLSNKTYKDLKLKNIRVNKQENNLDLYAEIENKSTDYHEEELVNLVFLSDSGKLVCSNTTSIPNIESKGSANWYVQMDTKCKSAYTFVIEKIEEEGNNEYE